MESACEDTVLDSLGPSTRDPRSTAPEGYKPGRKFTFTPAQVDRGVATTPTSPVTSNHTVPSDIILTESSSAALNYSRLEN